MITYLNLYNVFIFDHVNFGKDIKKIEFKNKSVIKTFKNRESYKKTINFYNLYIRNIKFNNNYDIYINKFPQLIKSYKNELKIECENCGKLLNINNLPNDWKNQLNIFRKFFLFNKILILDIRFMPHTPYIINNLCKKNGNIYLVDLALYEKKTDKYINLYFDRLIYQIETYNLYKKYIILLFIIHIWFELFRLFRCFIENTFGMEL